MLAAVPAANTRTWIEVMPGEDHGNIISKRMPDIFAFFKAPSK